MLNNLKKAKAVGASAPPADPMDELKALAARIDLFRSELEAYIDEHCKVIAASSSGVPFENIKMMITARSNCPCMVTTRLLNEKAVALELEKKH